VKKEELLKELKNISSNLEQIAKSINSIINILDSDAENSLERITSEVENTKPNEDKINNENIKIFERFFKEKNCEIVKYSKLEEEDNKVLLNISKFIGTKYQFVYPFLKELKKSLNTGKPIRLFLKDAKQEEISYICQLAKNLHDIAFLEKYQYQNAPKYILLADPLRESEIIKFINGHWLELFIIAKVRELLENMGLNENIDYSFIYNIQIRLPNGNYAELDTFFKIKDEYYWIEAKTGEYQRYVHKYSKMNKLFGLPIKNTFMVITEVTDAGAEAISGLFKMSVTNLNTFEEKFLNSLKRG